MEKKDTILAYKIDYVTVLVYNLKIKRVHHPKDKEEENVGVGVFSSFTSQDLSVCKVIIVSEYFISFSLYFVLNFCF